MSTHSGHPYLLKETNKSHTSPMDSHQIVAMFAMIHVKLDTRKTFEERLAKVEAMHKPPESPTDDQTSPRKNRHNTDNPSNPDAQYLKASRSMSPTLMDITVHNFS